MILLLSFSAHHLVLARDQADPTMYTATTSNSTTSTTKPGDTIQSVALQAAGNSNKGRNLANAAIGVTTAGVIATCWASANSACKYFVAGLAASMGVRMFMSGASDTSYQTAKGVTTTDDPYNPGTTSNTTPSAKPDTSYTQEPEWKNAQQVIKKLTNNGWKVDVPTGNITTPSGKTYNASVSNSADSMKASGASDSTIKSYQSAMAKIPLIAAEKAKSLDGGAGSLADESVGSGAVPATSAVGVGEGQNAIGSQLYAKNNSGIGRDPAQVAGMAKDFNGSKIGVAADSLFEMIDRRYNLHQKAGSFLGANGK